MADKETALLEELRAAREESRSVLGILKDFIESLKPKPMGAPDEEMARRMEQFRGKPSLQAITVYPNCTSPDTNSTFDVDVRGGVVFGLHNYKEPEGAFKHQRDGGLVPDGMPMYDLTQLDAHGNRKRENAYKQWFWTTFLQADLLRFVGKPCPKYLSDTSKPDPAPVAPPATAAR